MSRAICVNSLVVMFEVRLTLLMTAFADPTECLADTMSRVCWRQEGIGSRRLLVDSADCTLSAYEWQKSVGFLRTRVAPTVARNWRCHLVGFFERLSVCVAREVDWKWSSARHYLFGEPSLVPLEWIFWMPLVASNTDNRPNKDYSVATILPADCRCYPRIFPNRPGGIDLRHQRQMANSRRRETPKQLRMHWIPTSAPAHKKTRIADLLPSILVRCHFGFRESRP